MMECEPLSPKWYSNSPEQFTMLKAQVKIVIDYILYTEDILGMGVQ
jgi:hypothetical protein